MGMPAMTRTDDAPTVCVDFDGVIHAYSKGWQDGSIYDEPVRHAYESLRFLMQRYAVVIHTTRDPAAVRVWMRKQFPDIETTWFTDENKVPEFWNEKDRILITRKKLPAVAYIDDRAIRFVAWPQALAELEDRHGQD